ncbi:class I SAM-dependent methyltransferase [Streptomyces phaeofaciens]|uniref:class I SAM-dependent methyltransferase n=1 Tax=Streptomyces phaeofaciens TaxID=68254 RepID=UPI0036C402C0
MAVPAPQSRAGSPRPFPGRRCPGRRPRPLFGLPAERTAFRVADLEDTGLPDGCADGIVCVDALGGATDRIAALRELRRVLAPGGRLVMTRASRLGAAPPGGTRPAPRGSRSSTWTSGPLRPPCGNGSTACGRPTPTNC